MRNHLRKIGNSSGVIIPSALLEACGQGDEVELLCLEVIQPVFCSINCGVAGGPVPLKMLA